MTFTDIDALAPEVEACDAAFHMDEDTFRLFYDRTARGLAAYLTRLTGDRQLASDLLQEAYYRFLRAATTFESEAHQRNYLFRIATNLVRDGHRRPAVDQVAFEEELHTDVAADHDAAERVGRRHDLRRAMGALRPRDRALLWLAYAQGSTHVEIAATLGLKAASVKSLLFRARRRLVDVLRPASTGPAGERER
jgi:RNA polymerase sigma-70 factor, ECF subfamily